MVAFRYQEGSLQTSRGQGESEALVTFGCDIGARGRDGGIGWRRDVARRNLSGVRGIVVKYKWKGGRNEERRGRERRVSHIEAGSDL